MPPLRDRFVRYFNGEPGTRPSFMCVFGPMRQTVQRWLDEGMDREDQWFHDVGFEGEPGKQFGDRPAANAFVSPTFEPEVLEDNGETRTVRNQWGQTTRAPSDGSVMAIAFEFPVRDRATWGAMKERFRPDSGQRFPDNWEESKRGLAETELPVMVGGLPCGFFGGPRELFGLQGWLTCFYDDPALAHDVLDTLCELWCDVFGRIASETRVDLMFIWEDMCYRGGPLLSPALFREFMLPRYKRLTCTLREAGIPLMLLDTDGNCSQLNELFIEGGVDIVIPFEVQAGMDVQVEREKHPTLGLIGGTQKTTPSKPEGPVPA